MNLIKKLRIKYCEFMIRFVDNTYSGVDYKRHNELHEHKEYYILELHRLTNAK